jgi:hypothetical protein
MAINFDDYVAKLPRKRRRAIEERAAELIAEEATSRRSCEARERATRTPRPTPAPVRSRRGHP